MQQPIRPFWVSLCGVWIAVLAAGFIFSHQQNIPAWLVWSLLPVAIVESGLYLASGFEAVRERLGGLGSKPRIALVLVVAALSPYLLYTLSTGEFVITNFLVVTLAVVLVSFWYVVLPVRAWSDVLFLALFLSVILARSAFGVGLQDVYPSPIPKLHAEVLGLLMWTRTGILAVLLLRGLPGVGFGFIPTAREWWIGLQSFLFFVPIAYLLNFVVRFAHLKTLTPDAYRLVITAVGFFAGVLWVLSVYEEFFVRGMLFQLMRDWWHSTYWALAASSIAFGLGHLWFGHAFPNWRFAVMATVAGLFYALAFIRAGSVRASMVSHAFVVTVWKTFFTS